VILDIIKSMCIRETVMCIICNSGCSIEEWKENAKDSRRNKLVLHKHHLVVNSELPLVDLGNWA